MEHDSRNTKDMEKIFSGTTKYHRAHDGDVFQSSWLRRTIQSSNGLDRFLLEYSFDILPYFCFIIYTILLLT